MWQKNVRYLDYNATSGISDFVKTKLIEFLENDQLILANPSSRHRLGQRVSSILYESSRKIAATLGVKTEVDELVFTSSGTESNQTILRTLEKEVQGIIIGAGEHSASYDLLESFPDTSFVRELPLLRSGQYDLDELNLLLARAKESGIQKLGLSLAWANNETGVILDLPRVRQVIASSGVTVLLHLDSAQAWGKISIDAHESGAHYLSFSSHKIGTSGGTGVIWVKKGLPFHGIFPGKQQFSRRGGTENILGIVSLGFAAEAIAVESFQRHTSLLRDRLEASLQLLPFQIEIFAVNEARVTNTTRLGFKDFHQYQNWVELLDLRGFAVSHGSACQSKVVEPSRVLLKMGVEKMVALNSIRVSFGPKNTIEDVDQFVQALESILVQKREQKSEVRA